MKPNGQNNQQWVPQFGHGAPVLGTNDPLEPYFDLDSGLLWHFDFDALIWRQVAITVGGTGFQPNSVLLQRVTTQGSQASVDFTNIPQIYQDLVIVCNGASQKAAATFDSFLLSLNGDGGAHYTNIFGFINNGGSAGTENVNDVIFSLGYFPAAGSQVHASSGYEIRVINYRTPTFYKIVKSSGGFVFTDASGSIYSSISHGYWQSLTAINRLTFSCSTGPFVDGSVFSLYGSF